jgi:chemosensory pili system protein ChpA (sensor histidine kinase/response regulator)
LLAQALNHVIEGTVRSGQAPSTELAMEVATAVLYLEAAFEDLDPSDTELAARTARLAERLDHVGSGGHAEALETLDGGAVPPRQRPPDHGQRGG